MITCLHLLVFSQQIQLYYDKVGPFLFANDRKASNIIQQLTLLLLRSPFAASVSIAGIFQPLPDDKYDVLYLINGAG